MRRVLDNIIWGSCILQETQAKQSHSRTEKMDLWQQAEESTATLGSTQNKPGYSIFLDVFLNER